MLHQVVCSALLVCFIAVAIASAPVGLVNRANACFANSIMQALFHIPSFRRAVAESKESSLPVRNPILHRALVASFEKLTLKAQNPENLYDFYDALLAVSIDVRNQGVAGVFITCLLYASLPAYVNENLFRIGYRNEYVYNDRAFRLSEGYSGSPFWNLAGDNSLNFVQNLDNLFLNVSNNLSDEDKDKINRHRQVNRMPPIDWDRETVSQKTERFPNKIILVSVELMIGRPAFVNTIPLSINAKGKQYHLISAVIWQGTQQGGHFWAIVKTDPVNNVWYKLDDRRSNRINEEQVMEEVKLSNYLFYVQEDEINQNRPLVTCPNIPTTSNNPSTSGSSKPSPVVAKLNTSNTTSNPVPIPFTSVTANTNTPSNSPNDSSIPNSPSSPANNAPSTSNSLSYPSSSSSGGGGGGSSSSGSSRPSSSSSTSGSSRTAPPPSPESTQPKTAAAKAIPISSKPIYKRPVFWVGAVGAVITVGVVATLVVMRSSS